MDWRTRIVVASCLAGCGPVVEPGSDGEADSSSADEGTTEAGTPQPTTVDVATSDPTSDPPPHALSGYYLFALALNILPETPLQWHATVGHNLLDGNASMMLQPLSLDVGATTTPRMPVGDPLHFVTPLDPDGYFRLDLGYLYVMGAANPITGADIEATVVIEGTAMSRALWCGAASGSVTVPLDLDLTGSTFAFTPVYDGMLPGDPVVAACP